LRDEKQLSSRLSAYPKFVFPTIMAIRAKGGSATIEEIEDSVAELMQLSEAELSVPHKDSNVTEFQYRLAIEMVEDVRVEPNFFQSL